MNIFKTLLLSAITLSSAFITLEPAKSQGEIEVTQCGKSYNYKAGDAFVEDVGVVHESKNIGNVPVKAIVVAIGVEGQKIMTPVK